MPGPDVDDKEGSQPVRLPDGTEPSGTSSSSNAGTAATTVPAPTASSADASDASALHAPPSSAVTVPGEQPSTSSVASPSGPAASQDPSSQLPAIPPRNYPRDARLLQYTPPQPRQRLRPSQTLPRFIRFLAAFIFIAGSGATLAAFLYRRYLYPRLLLARTRLTELQQNNLSKYEKLLVSLRSLVTNNATLYKQTSTRLIAGRSVADPTLPAAAQADIANGAAPAVEELAAEEKQLEAAVDQKEEELDEAQPLLTGDEGDTARKAGEEAVAEGGEGVPVPVLDLTHNLREALGKLQASLLHDARPSSSAPAVDGDKKSYLPEPTPAQSLQRTLDSFSTYLTNESFYASTPSYPSSAYGYNYGSMGSAIPTRSGMDKDKIAQLKTDIRGLKGALLTRKNFAPVTAR